MRQARQHAERLIHEYGVDTTSEDAPARNLSGGNLQLLLLARALSRNPMLLLAAQPTSGLDIGATGLIRNKLMEQRDRGAAILLVSEDLDEIMTLSDRIAVMYGGEIVAIVPASQANVKEIGLVMTGAK